MVPADSDISDNDDVMTVLVEYILVISCYWNNGNCCSHCFFNQITTVCKCGLH